MNIIVRILTSIGFFFGFAMVGLLLSQMPKRIGIGFIVGMLTVIITPFFFINLPAKKL